MGDISIEFLQCEFSSAEDIASAELLELIHGLIVGNVTLSDDSRSIKFVDEGIIHTLTGLYDGYEFCRVFKRSVTLSPLEYDQDTQLNFNQAGITIRQSEVELTLRNLEFEELLSSAIREMFRYLRSHHPEVLLRQDLLRFCAPLRYLDHGMRSHS